MPLTTAPAPAASAALPSAATTTAALPSRWYSASSSDAAATTVLRDAGADGRPVTRPPREPVCSPACGRPRAPASGPPRSGPSSPPSPSSSRGPATGSSARRVTARISASGDCANPAYLLLFAASIALLIVTIVPNKLPREARAIALPLLLGGLLLGLAWSYLTGPFGTGPGVDAMALGAVLLVVGGLLDLRPARRSAASQP